MVDSVAQAKVAELGLSAVADTTDATGTARLPADEGRFWIYAVYVLPDRTLEWNLPVTVRGDSTVIDFASPLISCRPSRP